LVTFLWSTSFIIIKLGLTYIPPITFAGLRYSIACILFIPIIIFNRGLKTEIRLLTIKDYKKLIALGIIFYSFTQGSQFLGLALLPSVTVSLMLNLTPIIVSVAGIFILSEIPTNRQWIGIMGFFIGIIVYFLPSDFSGSRFLGIIVMGTGVLANSGSSILGRGINRDSNINPIIITFISMGIGSFILLVSGLLVEGVPVIELKTIGFLFWLAAINTTFAFTLWNYTLRSLTAMESSVINGTMLIQIALLAWIFLGEEITILEIIGMVIASISVLVVQIKR